VESPIVATYPSAGRRRGAHECVFQERKMRRVATNVYLRKTSAKLERCGLRTLIVKGSGVVFTHGEGNSTPRIRHKGRQPFNQVCKYDFKMFYFPFFMSFCVFILFVFFIFLWSTRVLPSIAMRKLDLRSSFRIERWLSCYYLFFLQDIF